MFSSLFLEQWRKVRGILANDYSFLLILGVMMATISFGLDYVIEKCQMGKDFHWLSNTSFFC